MIPLCTRLSCLDTGPIVAAIKAVARREFPDIAAAQDAALELAALGFLATGAVEKLSSGTLTATEALALLADEPCPPTQRNDR